MMKGRQGTFRAAEAAGSGQRRTQARREHGLGKGARAHSQGIWVGDRGVPGGVVGEEGESSLSRWARRGGAGLGEIGCAWCMVAVAVGR